jgi:hypothetical protein
MQAGYMKWQSWMTKHGKEILDQPPARSGPKPGRAAAVCRGGAGTDGPFVEGKEIVGGWSFIEAPSLARALEIAKAPAAAGAKDRYRLRGVHPTSIVRPSLRSRLLKLLCCRMGRPVRVGRRLDERKWWVVVDE